MSPIGEIELTTASALDRSLAALVHSLRREIWIDLTQVTFMDVAGLHVLLDAQRELERDHRRLRVVVREGVVRRLLDAAEVGGLITIQCDRRRTAR